MTTAEQRTPRRQAPAVSAVPFSRLVRVELRKSVASRSGAWLLAVAGLVLVTLVTVTLLTDDPEGLDLRGFVDVTSAPLSLLLPLLAILAVTTEWTQRTALTTFTLEPDRTRVVLAKLVAVLAVGLLAVAVALATAAVGNVVGAAVRDGSGAWSFTADDLVALVLTLVLGLVQAYAFGLLLTNTAAAIVVFFLLTPVWSTVLSLAGSLQDAAPWLDLSIALEPLTSDGGVSWEQWAQLASAATLWVLLPLVLGLVRLLRREITPD